MVNFEPISFLFSMVVVMGINEFPVLFENGKSSTIFSFGSIGSSVFGNEFMEFNFMSFNWG
jgi:hypothetical protein